MRISEVGEFALIDRIAAFLGSASQDVIVGIGDDVAVLQSPSGEYLIATCDAQIENVHFLRNSISPYQLGRRVVAVNVSDIASVGGVPSWALVSLALTFNTETSFVDELYQGMQDEILGTGACIVGGNMSRANTDMVIDLFLLGKISADLMVLRRGALDGDAILVTGHLGDSRAGFELLTNHELKSLGKSQDILMERHLTPHARLKEGQLLARSGKVHAMIDVSDGLLGDISHVCAASRVGAEIWMDELPISQECEEVARIAGEDPFAWALRGGEDYELLFTADPRFVSEIQAALYSETGTSSRVIGRVVPESTGVVVLLSDGRSVLYSGDIIGWDHFRARI